MVIFGQISGAIALFIFFTAFVQVMAKKSREPTSAGAKFAEVVFVCLAVVILAAALTNIGFVILALIG